MQATVVDLRYRMNDVLKALDRNEDVEILYRGRKKGVLVEGSKHHVGAMASEPGVEHRSIEGITGRPAISRFT